MSEPKTLDETAIEYERAKRRAKRVVDAEERPPHPPLKALTLAELFERPAQSYLIDQFIPEIGLVQVVGEPGMFKTFFMLHAALSIASGQTHFFNFPIVKHGAVLYIAAEGAGALQFRIRAWCREHGVNPGDLFCTFRVIAMPVDFRDPVFQQELHAIVEEIRPVLIVPDTRARCTPGAEENSSKDMGEVVNFCSELQKLSAAVAFVHHPTKSDPKGGGRGSGAFFGALDTEVRIDSDDPPDTPGDRMITVICAKQKDDSPFLALKLVGSIVTVFDLEGREMAHDSGRPITSIVLRLANADDAADHAVKAEAEDRAIDLQVLATMHRYPAATNQKSIRAYVGLSMDVVVGSLGRILRNEWAVAGGRGKPYTITDLGKKHLPVAM